MTSLQHNSSLTRLDLSLNSIGASKASALATALQHNSSLTTLYLSNNNIGDSGMGSLARALENNSSLTSLVLSSNRLGDLGAHPGTLSFNFPLHLSSQVNDLLERNKVNTVKKSSSLFELLLPLLALS